MRADVFEQGMTLMESDPKVTQKDYDALALLISVASGRGSWPKGWEGVAPVANALMFSPRYAISRIEYIPKLIQAYQTGNPVIAKEATRQLISFLGFGTSVLGLAAMCGAKLESDPRSADWGKLRIGNTRIDIWAGYLQYIRFLARFTTSSTKTSTGQIKEQTPMDTLIQMFQQKESPVVGLLADIMQGEDYAGNEMSFEQEAIMEQLYTRLTPLFAQDIIEGVQDSGLVGGLRTLPSGLGFGVVTYGTKTTKTTNPNIKIPPPPSSNRSIPSPPTRKIIVPPPPNR
jgi:hypothetical protein